MKKSTKLFASAVAAVAIFFSTNVNAQKIGIGANVGIPTDDAYSFAAGLDVRLQFDVTKQLSVPVATGYTNFFAKDRTVNFGAGNVDLPDYGYIPVKTGLKYFLDPSGSGVYAMGEVGAAFGVTDHAKTTFLYAPTLGYSWSNGLDLGIKYENAGKGDALRLIDDKNRTGQIALRIAYGFKL
ncbi:hypothetical protein OQY15_00760 [Pedobacter sp. MC2016-15]|uniref:hypothetical protein n=1 Tax=Pedobacter sp. MC2016-15 TaxID=2994473 RepID=UPI002246D68A|nr:hypothetical protein [Pedobacter sp. MC2016-15]MCX2477597.1 hypothetical protein [Pedobacter sp. MC2016-15]